MEGEWTAPKIQGKRSASVWNSGFWDVRIQCETRSVTNAQVAAAPLREELPAGFDSHVARFEGWCAAALHAALARLGFFTTPGAPVTMAAIMLKARPPPRP